MPTARFFLAVLLALALTPAAPRRPRRRRRCRTASGWSRSHRAAGLPPVVVRVRARGHADSRPVRADHDGPDRRCAAGDRHHPGRGGAQRPGRPRPCRGTGLRDHRVRLPRLQLAHPRRRVLPDLAMDPDPRSGPDGDGRRARAARRHPSGPARARDRHRARRPGRRAARRDGGRGLAGRSPTPGRCAHRTWTSPTARSCASTPSRLPDGQTTRSSTRPHRPRGAAAPTPTACATRSGSPSTRRPGACSPATSGGTTTRRSTRSWPAATTAGPASRARHRSPGTRPRRCAHRSMREHRRWCRRSSPTRTPTRGRRRSPGAPGTPATAIPRTTATPTSTPTTRGR